ncbi:hypothetical protein CPC08DRAFT_717084 [Agrocybe pediades]|nr:hypothetical protein CPC08DRAFT_717084 [Agrocybe pediades]
MYDTLLMLLLGFTSASVGTHSLQASECPSQSPPDINQTGLQASPHPRKRRIESRSSCATIQELCEAGCGLKTTKA